MSDISQTLSSLFKNHRIVFWYDAKQELQAEYEAVALPDVEKVVLGNNQFGLKHRMLREQPQQKFLLYHAGPQPEHLANWLLDVQLAHGEFRADQAGLWLHELGLPSEFTEIVVTHAAFFKTGQQRAALKEKLSPNDSARMIRLKMTAVCAKAAPRLDTILEQLLVSLAEGKDDKIQLIRRCELEPFLWQWVGAAYGYQSDAPSVRDFALTLFQACYAMGLEEEARLSSEAVVFLKRWKESVRYQAAFKTLSAQYADILQIEQDLEKRPYRQLLDLDYFELIDRKILSDLVREVSNRTISSDTGTRLIYQRRQTVWYEQYAPIYEAIDKAGKFLQLLEQVTLQPRSFAHGLQQYSQTWFQLDQLYRQFIFHYRQSEHRSLLMSLFEEVENRYTNQYLLPLNDQWQQVVDGVASWRETAVPRQADFYAEQVRPFLAKDKKVFVIISDALRYEIGEELARRVRQEDRYEAELETAVSVLPSFTQLGMAALLPHEQLALTPDGKTVLVDGQSSMGTENRSKILSQATRGQATAMKAEEFLNISREESRELFRENSVVYIYHNQIDQIGDKRESEERVFDAAANAIEELILIIKRAANANATNMVVTADHGFIYQHRELDESDFASQQAAGEQLLITNRRYVLGHGLNQTPSFKKFSAAQLGLNGEMELLLPKSINRLRVKGAGSRYVHGGATLQEIVIPIIKVNKKRQSDVTKVNVDVLRGTSNIITTNQVTIRFYQTEAATAKVQPRTLRVGLYTQAGTPVSDQHELIFDFHSEHEREREIPVQFILTREAEEANGQEIILRLEEQVEDTSHYTTYKTTPFLLKRSFSSDFDF
ncbi:MAG: BREX-1 system phosphatase PglZ type A [Candidatus Promineifilaceae bacterium]